MVVEMNITINHFIGFIEGHRFVSVNIFLLGCFGLTIFLCLPENRKCQREYWDKQVMKKYGSQLSIPIGVIFSHLQHVIMLQIILNTNTQTTQLYIQKPPERGYTLLRRAVFLLNIVHHKES